MNSYFLFPESPWIYLPGHACLSPTLLTHSLGLILRGRSSPSRVGLTGIMIASLRDLGTGLTRRSGYFRKVGSPPPIQSCPTDVVLLPRSHLIANRAVRG